MMYTCIREWRDLTDRHLYQEGDVFPFDGREISEERITELSGTQNKAGFALIKAVPDSDDKTVKEEPKPAQRRKRMPKKAT